MCEKQCWHGTFSLPPPSFTPFSSIPLLLLSLRFPFYPFPVQGSPPQIQLGRPGERCQLLQQIRAALDQQTVYAVFQVENVALRDSAVIEVFK